MSEAVKPLGATMSTVLNSCSPSLRATRRMKGLGWPAAVDWVPALRVGLKGRAAGVSAQGAPSTPWLIVKLEDGDASGVSGELQGTMLLVVVKVPQVDGIANGPRGPLLKLSFSWLAGSCGLARKTVVS